MGRIRHPLSRESNNHEGAEAIMGLVRAALNRRPSCPASQPPRCDSLGVILDGQALGAAYPEWYMRHLDRETDKTLNKNGLPKAASSTASPRRPSYTTPPEAAVSQRLPIPEPEILAGRYRLYS